MSLLEDLRVGTFEEDAKLWLSTRAAEFFVTALSTTRMAVEKVSDLRDVHPLVDQGVTAVAAQVNRLGSSDALEGVKFSLNTAYHSGLLMVAEVVDRPQTTDQGE